MTISRTKATSSVLALLVVAAGVLGLLSLTAGSAPAGAVEGFHHSWDKARAAAKQANKPLFVHFTTTWCGWCRKIESEVYDSDAGKSALKAFIPVSLDCTVRGASGDKLATARANQKLMAKYGGQGYPFLVMLTPDGVLLNRFSGYKPVGPFTAELAKAQKAFEGVRELGELGKKVGLDSYEYNARALEVNLDMGDAKAAAAAAEKVRKLDPENKKGHAAQASLALMLGAQLGHDHAAAAAAYKDVRRFDPKNEKGVLEEAVFQNGIGAMQHLHAEDDAGRAKELAGPRADLKALVESGAKLASRQRDYFLLGYLHKLAGQKDQAKAVLTQAVAADPKSPLADNIRRQMQGL